MDKKTIARLIDYINRIGAIQIGRFSLTSGMESTVYFDGRLVTLSTEGMGLIIPFFLQHLHRFGIDVIGGPTLGADPIIGAVLAAASQSGLSMGGVLIRNMPKEHGTRKQIEGVSVRGKRVLLVDDTLATGGSLLQTAAAVKEEGGEIVMVQTIAERSLGGAQALLDAGYPIDSMISITTAGKALPWSLN